ncbi:MAG: hypothetical protein ACOX2F_06020 [bacterium]
MTKPKTFSWDEFKAKVIAEKKDSQKIPEKSAQERINILFKNYEKKAESIGSVYFLDWDNLEAHDEKFGKWFKLKISIAGSSNKKAFDPHPGIKYASFGNESMWFMGTSNKNTAKWDLSKAGAKRKPFVVEDSSLVYVKDFILLKKRKFKDFESFKKAWDESHVPFKGKGFYAVSYKTMFILRGKTNIKSYRGSLNDKKFLEMREILKQSSG